MLKAPKGNRFIVVGENTPDNVIYDPNFLGSSRSADFILIQATSTVGNDKASKRAFYRFVADGLGSKLPVRPDGIAINMVFVDREDWLFSKGEFW